MAHTHEYVLIAFHEEADGTTGAPVSGQEALDLYIALGLDGVHQHPHGDLVVTNQEEQHAGEFMAQEVTTGPGNEIKIVGHEYDPIAVWSLSLQVP